MNKIVNEYEEYIINPVDDTLNGRLKPDRPGMESRDNILDEDE